MKLADVEVGKDYAQGSPNSKYGSYDRVRVIEIGKFSKKTWNGYRYRASSKKRRAKCKYVWEDGSLSDNEFVADARTIIEPWESYAETLKAEEEAEERAKRQRKERKERQEAKRDELCDRLEDMGLEIKEAYYGRSPKRFRMRVDHRGFDSISMSFEDLEAVIDAAYEAGKRDAS